MKLDCLAEGSEFCPLLRLYDFNAREAEQLLSAARTLASGGSQAIAIHELPFVEAVQACRLTWCLTSDDQGVLPQGGSAFTCDLSASGWSDFAALIEPLTSLYKNGSFQWLIGGLTTTHRPSLLLSPSGQW